MTLVQATIATPRRELFAIKMSLIIVQNAVCCGIVNLLTYTLRTYLYCRAALELARPTGHAWSAVCLARGN